MGWGTGRPGGQPSLYQQHTPGVSAYLRPGFPNNLLLLGELRGGTPERAGGGSGEGLRGEMGVSENG